LSCVKKQGGNGSNAKFLCFLDKKIPCKSIIHFNQNIQV
jgi:hypothetical protein